MNTTQLAHPAARQPSMGQVLLRSLLAMAAVGAVLLVCVWLRPLEMALTVVRLRLLTSGMHSRYVVLDGERIHYYAGGPAQGMPVVLVHGLGARAEDWATLMPQLIKGGYRVYAIDLLGYGRSARPSDASYSIAQEAGMVEAFIDNRRLTRLDLAGWSMGGWVAALVALDETAKVHKLVLYDAAGLVFYLPYGPDVFVADTPAKLGRLENLLLPAPGPTMPAFVVRDFLRRQKQTGWVIARSVDAMMSGRDLLDTRLGALKMPVLIAWGKQDHLIPLNVGQDFHYQIPQSVLEIYDGCGHLAPAQCADQVAPQTLKFLKAEPPMPSQVIEIAP